ncbi:IDLSRF-like peptide [Drosophila sechellia]|uniref:GM26843 n=1 Tax=Drosophila sechellia TaxID=7238 RepID=B4IHV0_DROSE|nr:IDLSRF-like peptide [Drosophila sechellia]EDW49467.1 GM26843 [Drosophila sechellia]
MSFLAMDHHHHHHHHHQQPRQHHLSMWPSVAICLLLLQTTTTTMAIDLSRLYGHMANPIVKRSEACHPYEPFKCPGDGNCISIQYLCDGAPDCSDGYDEDMRLCTAAKRPPVEETASFLQSLIASHGPNYLEKLFGSKARDALSPLGGVEKVAIALSESQTIEDFGAALHLMRSDLEHLRSVFMAVENGDLGMLKSLGIKDSELGDVKFFLEKLVNTGFLD